MLARALPATPGLDGATLRPLAGGLRARSWLVSAAGRELVVRLPERGAAPLLDVATEARVMRAAAERGLAPAVVAADEGGALITEYVPRAVMWTRSAARRRGNVARVAAYRLGLKSGLSPVRRLKDVDPDRRWRNFDAFDLVLNHT